MTIEVELADNTVLEFPDGTPDDVIDRTVKRIVQQQQGQEPQQSVGAGRRQRRETAPPQEEPRQATAFPATGTAGRVATEIVGGVTDMIPGLSFFAEQVGLGVPLEGEDQLPPAARGAARAVGQAATLGAGVLAGPLRAAAGGVEQAIAGVRSASQGVQSGIRATGQRFVDDTVTFAQTRPGAFFGIELGAASAGGAAGESVRTSGGDPTLAMLAELAGGGAAAAAIPFASAAARVSPVTQFVKGIAGVGPGAAQRRAAARVQRAAGADPEQIAERARQARQDVIPEAPLSLAELAENEGLLQLQRSVAAATAELSAAEQLRFANVNRVSRETLRQVPRAGGLEQPEATPEEARVFLDSLVQERMRAARVKVDESLEALGPRATREDANALARTEIDRAFGAAKEQERALYEQVPVVDAPIAATSRSYEALLREAAQDRVAQQRVARDFPPVLRAALGKLNPETGTIEGGFLRETGAATSQELVTLRSDLQQAAAAERAKDAPNRRLIRVAEQVADGILRDLDSLPAGEALSTARGFSRDLNQRFRQGEVGRILGFERTGEAAVAPGLTLEATLGAQGIRGASAADELLRAVERTGDPEAMRGHIQDFLRDEFLRAAREGGTLNPTKARNYLRRRQDILRRFPELGRQMQQALTTGEEAAVAEGLQKPGQSAAALVLRAPPGTEFRRLLNSPAGKAQALELRELLEQDTTGRAIEGMRRAMTEEIFRAARTPSTDVTDEPFLSARRLGDILSQPNARDVLVTLGDPGMFQRMRRVQATLSRLERGRRAPQAAEGIIGDGESALIGLARRFGAAALGREVQARSGIRASIQGVSAFTRAADTLAARGVDPAEVLLVEAISAPDTVLLNTLLNEKGIPNTPQARKRLNAWAHATALEYGLGDLTAAEPEQQ